MSAYDTIEQRQGIYDRYAASLTDLMLTTEAHETVHPDCDARPLCLTSMQDLAVLLAASPSAGVLYIAVAVQELRKSAGRVEELERQLEVARELTARTARDAAALELTNELLVAEIDGLEHGVRPNGTVLP